MAASLSGRRNFGKPARRSGEWRFPYSRASPKLTDLLPPQLGEFFKEDGMRIVDEKGRRVATA
jgi:hypothetical protein